MNAAETDKTFFIDRDGLLKKEHRYYTQVQLDMLVNHKSICDFIVYTDVDCHIVTIPIDGTFCEKLITCCDNFFHYYMLPEIVTHCILDTLQVDAPAPSSSAATSCENEEIM